MSTTTELIVLVIEAKGEIVSSNFTEFAAMVRARLAEINRDLSTDDDFDQAATDAKLIAGAEAELKAAKVKALADAIALNELFEQIDGLSGDLAAARLDLDKQIAKRKEEVKAEIVEEALKSIPIDPTLRRNKYLSMLQTAIKGKRTVDSMTKSVGVQVACIKAGLARTEVVLVRYETAYGADSLPDRLELSVLDANEVEANLRRRIEVRQERLRTEAAEKEAKNAREAAAKAQAELAESIKPPLPPEQAPVSAPPARGMENDASLFERPLNAGGIGDDPPLPPVGVAGNGSPSPNLKQTISQESHYERETFKTVCKGAFAKIKDCRESLIDPANTAAVKVFGDAVNAGWQTLMSTWKGPTQ